MPEKKIDVQAPMIPLDPKVIATAACAAWKAGVDVYTYLAQQWNVPRAEAKQAVIRAAYSNPPLTSP